MKVDAGIIAHHDTGDEDLETLRGAGLNDAIEEQPAEALAATGLIDEEGYFDGFVVAFALSPRAHRGPARHDGCYHPGGGRGTLAAMAGVLAAGRGDWRTGRQR